MLAFVACLSMVMVGQIDDGPRRRVAKEGDQPVWLAAHVNFERAGELIVQGNYLAARNVLETVARDFEQPYHYLAKCAAQSLPLPDNGGAVEDLLTPRDFDDPSGKQAASPSQFELRTADDLYRLGEICSSIEAHHAAITLFRRCIYRRCLARADHPEARMAVVREIFATNGHPEEAARLIDRISNRSTRDYWEKRLETWREQHQDNADPVARLAYWHGEAPLARLRELESLRPLLATQDQRIALLRQQVEAFDKLHEYRQRDAYIEAIINIADDRPEVCGEVLYEAAQCELYGDRRDTGRALEYCERIVDEHPAAPQLGQALAVLGAHAYESADWGAAIKYYARLFQWAEERAQTAVADRGKRKQFGVDLHQPAMQLSRAYQSHGDLRQALKYARLARDKHKYQTSCGTGLEEHLSQVRDRVIELEKLAEATPLTTIEFIPIEVPSARN